MELINSQNGTGKQLVIFLWDLGRLEPNLEILHCYNFQSSIDDRKISSAVSVKASNASGAGCSCVSW
jgi:hypothetical protein